VFYFGQVSKSSLASSTSCMGASIVVVVKSVNSPFVWYVSVGSGKTASNSVDDDFEVAVLDAILLFSQVKKLLSRSLCFLFWT
jgi:hypothetical protein